MVGPIAGGGTSKANYIDESGDRKYVNESSPLPVAPFSSNGSEYDQDPITGAFVTTKYPHHKMHEGNHYFVKTWIRDAGGAANQTFFAFTTPDTTKRVHARAIIAPDVDFTVNIYEGSVITGGTPVLGINNDRDSDKVAGLVAVANPAHTTPGALIWAARTGGGKNSVGVSPGLNYEIIAARNTTYVFELIKNIANVGIVDIDFFWYEHEPRIPA
jgi:hypothetical protein